MASNYACSSLTSTTCTSQQGAKLRRLRSLKTNLGTGLILPFKVPVNPINNISSKCGSQRGSASIRIDTIEKPLLIHKSSIRRLCDPTISSSLSSSGSDYASTAGDERSIFSQINLSKNLSMFIKFCRPYTTICTIVGIPCISLLPLEAISDLSPVFFVGVLKALIPMILINIYSAGINQLYDVEIDKVNKPYLPIASGELSMAAGIAIVTVSASLSIAMGLMFQSPPLLCAILTYFIIGSAYSIDLPFLRWKKNAFVAATSILAMRALAMQLGIFFHIQKYVLGKPMAVTTPLVFATSFMCMLCTVFALMKDIPDVDGDKAFGIQTFSVRLGKERVFWLCISMMLMTYGAAMAIGASSSLLSSRIITVLGHGTLASILWSRARSIDLSDNTATQSFYLFLWKMCYAEYLLMPFVR